MALSNGALSLDRIQQNINIVHNPNAIARGGLVWLNTFSMGEIERRLQEYTTFMVVRHPYQRLLSAWQDKFWYTYDIYGAKYARLVSRLFPEVMQGNKARLPFDTFLKLLLTVNDSLGYNFWKDVHWRDHIQTCHPCHIRYDHVMRMETMSRDALPILKLYNVTELPKFNTVGAADNITFLETRVDPVEVIQNLPMVHQQTLQQKYHWDMELLGYGLNGTRLTCGYAGRDVSGCC